MFITGLRKFELPQFPATESDPPVNELHQAIKNFVFTEEKILLLKTVTCICAVAAAFFSGLFTPIPWLILVSGSAILYQCRDLRRKNLVEVQLLQAQFPPFVDKVVKKLTSLQQRLAWMRQMEIRIEDGERLLEKQIQTVQKELELFERTCLAQLTNTPSVH